MSTLFDILDGIIATDEPDTVLASEDEIINYAEACGRQIDASQAKAIARAGRAWREQIENGDGEWSRYRHEAKQALSDLE